MSVNKLAACIILLSAGCTEEPCNIPQSTQNGMYELRLEETSGDCGRVWEVIETELIDGAPMPPDDDAGCSLNTRNWEPNTCSTRTTFDCNDAAFWEMQMDWIVTSHANDESMVFGTLRLQAINYAHLYMCESVYYFEGIKKE